MSEAETYRRGQVLWALWRTFTHGRRVSPDPPSTFLTRVKRLLELDRADGSETGRFAFVDEEPEGKGTDSGYSAFNALCLGLALDMLDVGFKQSEVVFFLQHTRDEIERFFKHILTSPPALRQKIGAEDRPDCPTYEENGIAYADPRIFLLTTKVEMTEVFPGPRGKPRRGPLIWRPVFCRGIEALRAELHRMNYDNRKTFVMELANLAVLVTSNLAEAPLIRRGRN